ncbi:MAG: hypothetical protein HND47_03555 [Chloroflexi bacterium]|nr:hypothetical protein [Chloroflexota bacterium]
MFNEEFRKATIQSMVAAMTGSDEKRLEWAGVLQDIVKTRGDKLGRDEISYLEGLIIILQDANDLEKADARIPDVYAEDWKTILKIVNHTLTANEAGQSISLEARGQIMNNTVAVLTHSTDRKGDWLNALRGLKQQALEEYKMPDLAQYLGALIRLVEGEDAEDLEAEIPALLRSDWEQIVKAIT